MVEVEFYSYYHRSYTLLPNYLVSTVSRFQQIFQEDMQQCIQVLSLDMVRELLYSLEISVTRIFFRICYIFQNREIIEMLIGIIIIKLIAIVLTDSKNY